MQKDDPLAPHRGIAASHRGPVDVGGRSLRGWRIDT
jgi:hypothetical protein